MIYEYDATAEICPLPLVKLRLMLKKMQKKDVCLLSIADKGSKKDIPKLLNNQGYCFKATALPNNIVHLEIIK